MKKNEQKRPFRALTNADLGRVAGGLEAEIDAPRDAASGLATGKRQHAPIG